MSLFFGMSGLIKVSEIGHLYISKNVYYNHKRLNNY